MLKSNWSSDGRFNQIFGRTKSSMLQARSQHPKKAYSSAGVVLPFIVYYIVYRDFLPDSIFRLVLVLVIKYNVAHHCPIYGQHGIALLGKNITVLRDYYILLKNTKFNHLSLLHVDLGLVLLYFPNIAILACSVYSSFQYVPSTSNAVMSGPSHCTYVGLCCIWLFV